MITIDVDKVISGPADGLARVWSVKTLHIVCQYRECKGRARDL